MAIRLPGLVLPRPICVLGWRSPGRARILRAAAKPVIGFHALVRFADRGINPSAGKSSTNAADGAAMRLPDLALTRPVRALGRLSHGHARILRAAAKPVYRFPCTRPVCRSRDKSRRREILPRCCEWRGDAIARSGIDSSGSYTGRLSPSRALILRAAAEPILRFACTRPVCRSREKSLRRQILPRRCGRRDDAINRLFGR